jgi:hypothetical protein
MHPTGDRTVHDYILVYSLWGPMEEGQEQASEKGRKAYCPYLQPG